MKWKFKIIGVLFVNLLLMHVYNYVFCIEIAVDSCVSIFLIGFLVLMYVYNYVFYIG